MRYLLIGCIFVALFFASHCEAQNIPGKWSLGLRLSPSLNFSHFEGTGTASGRFEIEPLPTSILGVMVRRELSKRWRLEAGINLSSVGFRTTFSQDYAINQPMNKIESSYTVSLWHVPLTVVWSSLYNCKNWRTYAKAGFGLQASHQANRSTKEQSIQEVSDVNNPPKKISITVQNQSVTNASLILGIGREKRFKGGSLFSYGLSVLLNTSEEKLKGSVSYIDGNQAFTHNLVNSGSYISIDFMYFFPQFKVKNKVKLRPIEY